MSICPKCGRRFEGPERFCARDGTVLVDEGSARSGEDDPLIGALLAGRYELLARLGEGGMGAVYLARQQPLGRQVAVKLLRGEASARVGDVRRFLREALACSKLDHPSIVSTLDFGRDDRGRYYLVMEYVEGTRLSDFVQNAVLSQPRVLVILDQVLAALAAAHEAGVIHRDLKPENVICTTGTAPGEGVKILDFGLAKLVAEDRRDGRLTRAGFVVGTPEFMSPEQAWGRPVDHRSDLYAVGVMAYEMLCGVLPFTGSTAVVADKHMHEPPRRPSEVRAGPPPVDPDLEAIVLTLLAKKPRERFQSAEAARTAIATVARRLEQRRDEAGDLLARTRAALDARTPIALEACPGPGLEPSEAAGSRQPTAMLARVGTSGWEVSELREEAARLASLWSRRIVEVADLLWGPAARTPRVAEALESARLSEARIAELETELALEEARREALEREARREDAERRFRHLDLVARLGGLQAAVEQAPCWSGEHLDDFPEDGDTEPAGDLEELGLSEAEVRREIETIRREIGELELVTAEMALRHARELGGHEARIRGLALEVGGLRRKLVPVYSGLADLVRREASTRPELAEQVFALDEVSDAIEICQVLLESGGGAR